MSPLSALLVAAVFALASCDKESTPTDSPAPSAAPPAPAAPTPQAPPPEMQAPEIIVDHTTAAIGKDRVPVGEPGLADRVAALLAGRPGIEGQTAQFVAMRNAKPSQVAAVVDGLRRAKAAGAIVKSEARDGTTEPIALSFAPTVADCTTVAWIAKDAAIDVWSAGGGGAKRVVRGLAGPDMTLGLAAVREHGQGCGAPEFVVGGDDTMPWGLVFDLAESALTAPSARVSAAILVTTVLPGRKVALR